MNLSYFHLSLICFSFHLQCLLTKHSQRCTRLRLVIKDELGLWLGYVSVIVKRIGLELGLTSSGNLGSPQCWLASSLFIICQSEINEGAVSAASIAGCAPDPTRKSLKLFINFSFTLILQHWHWNNGMSSAASPVRCTLQSCVFLRRCIAYKHWRASLASLSVPTSYCHANCFLTVLSVPEA